MFLYPLKACRQGVMGLDWPLGALRGLQGGWFEMLRVYLRGHLGQDRGKPQPGQSQQAKTKEVYRFSRYVGSGRKRLGFKGV